MSKKDISPKYNPADLEEKWYSFWAERGYFHADKNSDASAYSIVIPPPNVTGILHMGHAFNNTLQDILIRTKRMQGFNTLWVPGTDHAGIATQNVVEKSLMKEGKKREDLGRDKFIEKVWEWKKEHGSTIINQLKRLGATCDWERERFTMDEGLSDAVKEAFCRLYDEGLIYRGFYLVNWCPRCGTALADDEVEHQDKQGAFYYIKYFFKDHPDDFLTIATTRPETMLGDTAVAVNPADERYSHYIGEKLILPLVGREIPIIGSKLVDLEFGTGALKVTPAHDMNDYEIGKENDLEFISIMDTTATMNDNAGEYKGLDRYECRKKIVEDLKDKGYLIKVEPFIHAVGHCYRCDTEIEPMYSEQWFVRMKELAKPALKAVSDGKIKFHPDRWKKVYENWLNGIRDWCISRQLWWGHRIPVFYCDECGHTWASKYEETKCQKCSSSNIRQDEDVLDTWFSSSLWPFSTLGWPKKTLELEKFYPTSTLSTAFDIIFFWVARMIMMGLKFMEEVPFRDIYIHALLRDEQGRKMSKSLGNAIDPVKVIEKFGTDALRFTLSALAVQGRDVNLSVKRIETFRNFMNKIWNAHRYILMRLDDDFIPSEIDRSKLKLPDKWILSKLENLLIEVNKNFDEFRFSHSSLAIYEFLWDEFCDWYIEISKVYLNSDDIVLRKNTQNILYYVLSKVITILHPYAPFITEEIRENMGIETPLIITKWPEVRKEFIDLDAENDMDFVREVVRASRNFRSEYTIHPKKEIAILAVPKESHESLIIKNKDIIISLTGASSFELINETEKPDKAGYQAITGADLYFPVKALVDTEKEIERLSKERSAIIKELEKVNRKLENKNFLEKAKPDIVQKQKAIFKELTEKLDRVEKNINAFE